jgi:hypothetical protein
MASSRRLVELDRCQATIMQSNSKIFSLSLRSWAPRAAIPGHSSPIDLANSLIGLYFSLKPEYRARGT